MKTEQQQLNIDIKTTVPIKSEDGNQIFQEGFLLRKVSRFVTGQPKDGLLPIPIYFDIITGRPVKETLPTDLWVEFGFTPEFPQPIEPTQPTEKTKLTTVVK